MPWKYEHELTDETDPVAGGTLADRNDDEDLSESVRRRERLGDVVDRVCNKHRRGDGDLGVRRSGKDEYRLVARYRRPRHVVRGATQLEHRTSPLWH